eukprot:RCo022539
MEVRPFNAHIDVVVPWQWLLLPEPPHQRATVQKVRNPVVVHQCRQLNKQLVQPRLQLLFGQGATVEPPVKVSAVGVLLEELQVLGKPPKLPRGDEAGSLTEGRKPRSGVGSVLTAATCAAVAGAIEALSDARPEDGGHRAVSRSSGTVGGGGQGIQGIIALVGHVGAQRGGRGQPKLHASPGHTAQREDARGVLAVTTQCAQNGAALQSAEVHLLQQRSCRGLQEPRRGKSHDPKGLPSQGVHHHRPSPQSPINTVLQEKAGHNLQLKAHGTVHLADPLKDPKGVQVHAQSHRRVPSLDPRLHTNYPIPQPVVSHHFREFPQQGHFRGGLGPRRA